MPPQNVRLPHWDFMGGEAIVGADTSVAGAVPRSADIVHIAAEGGVCYYQFGAGIASALSAGFVPENGRVIEGTIRNLAGGIVFFVVTGTTIHVQYYQENRGH